MAQRTAKKKPGGPHLPAAAATAATCVAWDERLRPWLLGAACALFFARPLFPSEVTVARSDGLAPRGDGLALVVAWALLAAVWAVSQLPGRRFALRFGWVDGLVLALVGLHAIAGLWAVQTASPRPAVNMVWQWFGFGLTLLMFRQLVRTARESRAVLAVAVAMAVAMASFGLYQFFYDIPRTQAEYTADPDGMLRAAGMWFPKGSPQRQQFENRLYSAEPLGTFSLTNSLAGYLVPWLIVGVGIAAAGAAGVLRPRPAANGETPRAAWLAATLGALATLAALGFCLLLTKSRSGCLAAALGVVLVLAAAPLAKIVSRRMLVAGIVVVVLCAVAFGLAVRGLDAEVFTEAGKSLGYRLQYWRSSLGIIRDHPWVGCGPGNFQEAYEAYKLPEASEEVADPHSFLFEVWATAGTPAALALVAALSIYFAAVLRRVAAGRRDDAARGPTSSAPVIEASLSTGGVAQYDFTAAEYGVALGGLAGMALGLAVAATAYTPVPIAYLLVGLPAALVVVTLLRPWVRWGASPPWLCGAAALGLLVNLAFAGGIGFPSASGGLWLLMAITFPEEFPREHSLPRWTGGAFAVLLAAVAAACYYTAARPTARCREAIEQAAREMNSRDPASAQRNLESAAAADPLAAEPWMHLAGQAFGRWEHSGRDSDWNAVAEADVQAFARAPRSASLRFEAARREHAAYSRTRNRSHLDEAIKHYREAVKRYPNNPHYEGGLAKSLGEAGEHAEAAEHADRALWLSEITPHLDKKLEKPEEQELRKLLPRNRSLFENGDPRFPIDSKSPSN